MTNPQPKQIEDILKEWAYKIQHAESDDAALIMVRKIHLTGYEMGVLKQFIKKDTAISINCLCHQDNKSWEEQYDALWVKNPAKQKEIKSFIKDLLEKERYKPMTMSEIAIIESNEELKKKAFEKIRKETIQAEHKRVLDKIMERVDKMKSGGSKTEWNYAVYDQALNVLLEAVSTVRNQEKKKEADTQLKNQ